MISLGLGVMRVEEGTKIPFLRTLMMTRPKNDTREGTARLEQDHKNCALLRRIRYNEQDT
jgi:hypothetical protein